MAAPIVVRRIRATPARSAAEAWRIITDLLAPVGTPARRDLDQIAGIAISMIAAEALRESPMVVYGVGPRLRVYCLYDDDAILGEDTSEEPLTWCPTDGEWSLSLPCPPEDLAWVEASLARLSTHASARDVAELVPGEEADQELAQQPSVGSVNREAFFRP